MSSLPHASTRRDMLLGSGALFAWACTPKLARAEGRDPRFLVVVLRGALDGLALAAPVGDPDWVKLRGDRALTLDGKPPALPLDSLFALNPAMPNLHRLYKAGEAAIVHAAATPYRERSHFDGQDVLESGYTRPGATGHPRRARSRRAPCAPPARARVRDRHGDRDQAGALRCRRSLAEAAAASMTKPAPTRARPAAQSGRPRTHCAR